MTSNELFKFAARYAKAWCSQNPESVETPTPLLFFKQNLFNLPMLIPTVSALLFPKRWVQWAGGLGFLAMMVGYTIAFCSTLG